MAKRTKRGRRPLKLVTLLVIGFMCVVAIALGLAGALAIPLLTANQQAYNSAQSDERLHCEVTVVEQQLVNFWKIGVLPNTATAKPSVKASTTCDNQIVANPSVPPNGNATQEQIQSFLRNDLVPNQRVILFVAWLPPLADQPQTPPWVYFDSVADPQKSLDTKDLPIPDPANAENASLGKNGRGLGYPEQVTLVARSLRGQTGNFTQDGQTYHYIIGVALGGTPASCLRRDMAVKATNPFGANPCQFLLSPDLPRGFRVAQAIPATFFLLAEPISDSGNFVANQLPALLESGAIALVVAILIAVLLARFIAQPLARISHGTDALAAGDFSYRVPEGGYYEIAHLAASFNRMVDEVAESQRVQRDLIGNVSHELKTPLTAIRGFSQAMTDGILKRPEDFAGPAQIINNETERMIRLVNTLLDLSKLEGGQVVLAQDPIDIADVLAHVYTNLDARATAANITLVRNFVPVPPVTADNDRILQILTNLSDNAIKYGSPGGRVEVVCGLRRASDSGPVGTVMPSADGGSPPTQQTGALSHLPLPGMNRTHKSPPKQPQFSTPIRDAAVFSVGNVNAGNVVWAEVRDTGQGISARDLPHIFERFYQAEKSRSKQVGGVGLGLAITKELILAQNGSISVQSATGVGTTFRVEFPVAADALPFLTDMRRAFPYERFYHPFSESLILSEEGSQP